MNRILENVLIPQIALREPIRTRTAAALLSREESEHFRTRWNEIQGKFVDEPRAAVEQAYALVSEVIEQITQMFANEHSSLEGQWNQGNDVSTEDLRKALQHYRSFFNRLVVLKAKELIKLNLSTNRKEFANVNRTGH
ncbi:MAG TPA: hypothetical protein VFZ76_10030 [Anaerolineales bacterium]